MNDYENPTVRKLRSLRDLTPDEKVSILIEVEMEYAPGTWTNAARDYQRRTAAYWAGRYVAKEMLRPLLGNEVEL